MSNVFGSRLKALREARSLIQSDVAAVLEITKSAYGFYEQGKREPDFDTLSTLADFFNVTIDFLLGRSNDGMSIFKESPEYFSEGTIFIPVPILGAIKAGPDGAAEESFLGNMMTEAKLLNESPHFWLQVSGDSMTGFYINDGDYVLVRRDILDIDNKICAVCINGFEATLKKVRLHSDGLILEAGNPLYPPRFFSKADIEAGAISIIGIAKEIRRAIS